ncbi:DNA/RNA non-specific endonuclease [Levilactobacillus suantsaii]|uniref:DNA-entry nuclease n=1 Tax=Levilactobacillus suantsaii TaxID=2292255 RepID=A0A4Q0VK63_9LACO|nr:DNA/RNA non-specific endonuclease [Levilactobacillus suantsaii]QMU08671.1 DNA/RNA non-specific endonuclease [Levilactobacillus suantsaii]RXI78593.1 DNA-entry nuclease [Levilactobacillus suantsaii]
MGKRRRRRGTSFSVYGAIIIVLIGLVGSLGEQGNPTAKKLTNEVTQVVDRVSGKSDQASTKTPTQSVATKALANDKYQGTQIVAVNHNRPTFTAKELSLKKGAWQKYGDLDSLNRVTTANAMLSKSIMPTAKRQALNVTPTGWHNKSYTVNGKRGYLYNRCHLIGYQLTGQNNNWKNLMTGTRSLNDPGMTAYENPVANYLKAHPKYHVRYQVQPVFRGNELVARGVHMQAKSIETKDITYNVYIYNIQAGIKINYSTGYSQTGDPAAAF